MRVSTSKCFRLRDQALRVSSSKCSSEQRALMSFRSFAALMNSRNFIKSPNLNFSTLTSKKSIWARHLQVSSNSAWRTTGMPANLPCQKNLLLTPCCPKTETPSFSENLLNSYTRISSLVSTWAKSLTCTVYSFCSILSQERRFSSPEQSQTSSWSSTIIWTPSSKRTKAKKRLSRR